MKSYAGNPLALRSFKSRLLNLTHLIQAGVPLVMTTDAFIWSPEVVAEMTPEDRMERLDTLGKGHFFWCRAMAEKGMPAMDIILAATRNVAAAYHELDQIGTLEKGKAADLVILEANPLEDINNLQKIVMVMKDGQVIDRDRLPIKKVVEPAEF
jgi:cytosine/adenosine deaminase-related metal-dependent hydrolase